MTNVLKCYNFFYVFPGNVLASPKIWLIASNVLTPNTREKTYPASVPKQKMGYVEAMRA